MTVHRTEFSIVPPLGRRTLLGQLAAALLAVPAGAAQGAAPAARDLLDTPALRTEKAARALLLGVARAGRRVVAVGERGIIVWSDDGGAGGGAGGGADGGAVWRQAAVPVSVTLTAVHFPTPAAGWAVGHDGVILHSADAGASWVRQFDGNAANALILAEARQRAETLRGDTLRGDPAADPAAREAADLAVEDALAGAEFGPSRPLLGVRFRDADTGLAVGSYGQIFRTGDGGRSWRSLGLRTGNAETLHFNAIAAAPSGALLIAGEGGRVYRSTDGGDRWEMHDLGTPAPLYGVRALPAAGGGPEVLLAYGFGGRIFRCEDGARWQPVESPTGRTLVASAEPGDAPVLVDAAGAVFAIADAGRSFRPLRPAGALPVAAAVATAGGALIQVGPGGARAVPFTV